ncbi:YSC84-related protein, partial [Planktotalea sp.]|uniref:YSC84-related protein n=1 Tax=Planktotalea sp. TaxID=2029877 RepID=UPI00329695AA
DYFTATKANFGIQIGANQYAHVLFFITEDALRDFRESDGWAAGADVDASFLGEGETLSTDTSTAMSPVVGIIFGQAGIRLGATIEGTKYTRMFPN